MSADALWLLIPAGQRANGAWIDDTLVRRAREKGMTARLTEAGRFPRQRVEVLRGGDPSALYYRRGWTDGLPIQPPTLDRVDAMLRGGARGRNESLGELDPLKGVATVERVAANAVMAGCAPEHFPVVLAAVEALADPAFNLRGVQTTDENVAPLILLSGPVVERLEVNAGFGMLGPGWQANAAIGRAVRFVMNNIGGGWPEAVSFAGLGQPGRYTMVLAENAAANPWEPLHEELGGENVLVMMRAETAVNVTGGLDDLASVMGSAASAFNMAWEGKAVAVMAPFVAQELAGQGWSKADAKQALWQRGRMPRADFEKLWLRTRLIGGERWPDWTEGQDAVPAVARPEDIVLVVAGGDIPIPQCAWFPSWGFPPCCIVKEIPA